MTKIERRWTAQVLEGFAPPSSPGLVPSANEVDWERIFSRIRNSSTPLCQLGMRIAIWIAVFAPIWMLGRPALIGMLRLEERANIINQLLEHRVYFVRELTVLVKIAAAYAFVGCATVRARSGYDRRPTPRKARTSARALNVVQPTSSEHQHAHQNRSQELCHE